jgi:hypothetical protein
MAFSTTPIVGLSLTSLLNTQEAKTVGPGVTVFGSNGRRYLSMTAGAEIASATGNGTQLAAPTQTLTAATGSGGWYSIPGVVVPAGAVFFAREGTIA